MSTNQELCSKLALDLGVDLKNRRPTAKEVFKWLDIDLLPHSSVDTLLCEIYEWSGRNWRTTGKNLIGEIFKESEVNDYKKALSLIPLEIANVPDFEFTKADLIDLDLGIPSLFNIGIKGDIKNALELSVKVNGIKKSRITNIDPPGIQIMHTFSVYAQEHSIEYRKKLKSNYLTTALFYAESVEIYLKRAVGVGVDLGFAVDNVTVQAKLETETVKEATLKYTVKMAPFAATFIKGKDF
jgi:hypothetical protein